MGTLVEKLIEVYLTSQMEPMFEGTMKVYSDLHISILKDGIMIYYLVKMRKVNVVILIELKLEGMMAYRLMTYWV